MTLFGTYGRRQQHRQRRALSLMSQISRKADDVSHAEVALKSIKL